MRDQLDSDLLRTFVSIADAGSFTTAARKIGRTQSAVSMQMKRLEDLLGQTLLSRGPGSVTPTPAGRQLLKDARPILLQLDRAAASLMAQPLSGSVRVGLLAEYGTSFLPSILARFAESHPNIEVTVTCAHSGVLYTALEQETLDLAIVLDKPGQTGGTILMRDATFWAASERHAVLEQAVLPVALFDKGCWWRDWALQSLRRMKRPYRIAYTSDNNVNLKAAVSAGLAVGLLSESMLPEGCRPLATGDGFPKAIKSNMTLRKRPGSLPRAVEAMAKAIKREIRSSGEKQA